MPKFTLSSRDADLDTPRRDLGVLLQVRLLGRVAPGIILSWDRSGILSRSRAKRRRHRSRWGLLNEKVGLVEAGRQGELFWHLRSQSSWRRNVDWRDHIIVDPKVLVGKPVIKGTRIAVEFVMDLLGRGWTVEQILREYDHLKPEDIQACLSYASDVLKSELVYLLYCRREESSHEFPRQRERHPNGDSGIAATVA